MKQALPYVAVLLIGLGIYQSINKKPGPAPTPEPTPINGGYPTPTAELQTLVAPLKSFNGKKNADIVAKFYWDFAEVIQRDAALVKTTSQFRNAHIRAQKLMAEKTDLAGSLPGLSSLLDTVLVQALGKDDGELPRAKAVSAMQAIAWALGGGV